MKINTSLFDNNLLSNLNFTECDVYLTHRLSSTSPGENLVMRPLCRNDFKKHYTNLLSQLTQVGDVSEDMFLRRFDLMKATQDMYYIVVIEDIATNKVIASGSLIVEQHLSPNLKFINHGRIEDIVVSSTHRKKQLGKLLLETLLLVAKEIQCDQISLECKDNLVKFYTQFNFQAADDQKYLINRCGISKL